MAHSHCTGPETGTGMMGLYILYTLHRDRDRDRERDREWGPLGSVPISPFPVPFPIPFPVPWSVNEPLQGDGLAKVTAALRGDSSFKYAATM